MSAQRIIQTMPRARWLGSGSALAAAIAMSASLAAPAAAQSVPQIPQNMPRGMDREGMPNMPGPMVDIPRGPGTEVTSSGSSGGSTFGSGPTAPGAGVLPGSGLSGGSGPSSASTSSGGGGSVSTFSSTPAPSPGDTNTNGLNVRASANYFASEIDLVTGAAADQVEVFVDSAIINWTTFASGAAGTSVDFLPAGATLNFISDLDDYTVLNRVFVPNFDSAIRIDGTVNSSVVGGGRGGNIWFYSPGGIIAGSTSTFNVGSLILTSSDLNAIAANGPITFAGVARPDTSVVIEDGANITAESFIALAPRVEQAGTVRVSQNALLVGAEQAEVSFSNGLFSVAFTVGTEDANGIVHTGSTGGPTTPNDGTKFIQMTTVSKNDAVTMLLGGNIGFDDAAAATTSNGAILLTAGEDTDGGSGNIQFGPGTINSTTLAQATGTISIAVDGTGGQGNDLTVGSASQDADFFAIAGERVDISATNGASVLVFGDFLAGATNDGVGGVVNVTIDDAGRDDDSSLSGLIVGGDLTLTAVAAGVANTDVGGVGGDATGGTLNINVLQGGELLAGGNLELNADAFAGFGTAQSGIATAGTVNLTIDGQNTRIGSTTGSMTVSSVGNAAVDPVDPVEDPAIGSASTGGAINLTFNGGSVFGSTLNVNVGATATQGIAGDGASATGGTIAFTNSADLAFQSIIMNADGTGADGAAGGRLTPGEMGGTGSGGTISFNSTVDLPNLVDLDLSARGIGGAGGAAGVLSTAGAGGSAIGGDIRFSVAGTGALLANIADVVLDTSARGGAGGGGASGNATQAGTDGAAGGSAQGGRSTFAISGAGATFTYNSGAIILDTAANGGAGGSGGGNFAGGVAGSGGSGGDATGGEAVIEAGSGSVMTLVGGNGIFVHSSSGIGGAGGTGGGVDQLNGGLAGNGGAGGNGTGGSPVLRAIGGTITGATTSLSATGVGGDGGQGGDDGLSVLGAQGNGGIGTGGTPRIETFDGSPGIITLGDVTIDASGIGGGGTVTGTTEGGSITITDASADPAGLITMSSLTATVTGSSVGATPSLTIGSDSGAVTVTGNVNATVSGDIAFVFDGDGQLAVGNDVILDAGGNVTAVHTNNTGAVTSIDAGRDFTANAAGDFAAAADTIIDANREITITASNIGFDRLIAGVDNVFDTGEFSVTLNAVAGSITGGPIGTITTPDGVDLDATQAISVGDITVTDAPIRIDAGTDLTTGNVSIAQGGLASNESIIMNAGGNAVLGDVAAIDGLTITAGGSLTSSALQGTGVTATAGGAVDVGDVLIFNGVANGNNITISGTSIAIDSASANTATGNTVNLTASAGGIVIGTSDSNGNLNVTAPGDVTFGVVTALGVFINSGGNVSGTSAASDRAINSGTPRDVQIIATGDVSVDTFNTVNDVEVTAASFTTNSITTGTGTNGAASDVIVNVTGAANIGTADVQGFMDVDAASIAIGDLTMLAATLLDSTIGDITIGNIATDGRILVNSAANLTVAGTSKLGNDTFGDESQTFNAAGSVAIAGDVDSHDGTFVTAGGTFDAANISAKRLVVTAGDAVSISNVVGSANQNSSITGSSVSLGTGDFAGLIAINATAGSINLTGDLTAFAAIDLDATGNIAFQNLIADAAVNVDAGGDITGISSTGTGPDTFGSEAMAFNAGGNLLFSGDINALDGITVTAGGSLTTQALIALDSLTVSGGGAVSITRAETVTLDPASITGGSVSLGSGAFAGSLTLDSTAGDIDLTGAVTSGVATLTSAGDVNFVDLSGEGNKTITAAGSIAGTNISGGIGDAGLDNVVLDAGADITITGTADSLDNVNATAGGAITIDAITSDNQINVNAGGAVNINSLETSTFDAAVVEGSSVTIGTGSLLGSLALSSTIGGITVTGAITSGVATLTSATDINFVSITGEGDKIFNAAGSIAGADISAGVSDNGSDLVRLDAGGNVTITGTVTALDNILGVIGGDLDAANLVSSNAINLAVTGAAVIDNIVTTNFDPVTVTGSQVTLGGGTILGPVTLQSTTGAIAVLAALESGAANFTAATDITFVDLTGEGDKNLTAGGNITGANISAGVSDNGSDEINILAGGDLNLSGSTFSFDGTFIDVSGDVTVTDIQVTDGLSIVAGGALNLANFDKLAPGTSTLQAGSINIGTGAGLGTVNLTSTVGDIAWTSLTTTGSIFVNSAANVNFTSVNADSSLDVTATGDVIFGNITTIVDVDIQTPGLIDGDNIDARIATLNGGSIDVQNLAASFNADLDSTVGDIVIGTLTSPGTNNILSVGQIQLGTADIGSIIADSAGAFVIGSMTSTGTAADINLFSDTSVTYTLIDADRLLNITAPIINGGDVVIDDTLDFTADSINVGNVTVEGTGNVIMAADSGALTIGDVVNGNIVNLNAATTLNTGVIEAINTSFTAGTDAVVGGITTNALTLNIGGSLDAGTLDVNGTGIGAIINVGADANIALLDGESQLDLNIGGALTGGTIDAQLLNAIDAASIDLDTVISQTAQVIATATGALAIGTVNTGTSASLTGSNVTLDAGTIGTSLTLNATAGNIAGTGTINVSNAINLTATGNVGFGSLEAGTTFDANAGGNITFTSATSGTAMALSAAGTITGDSVNSDSTLVLDGTIVDIGTLASSLAATVTADTIQIDNLDNGERTGTFTDPAAARDAADITLTSALSTTVGDGNVRILTINSGQGITLGNVNAIGRDIRGIAIDLNAVGDVSFASLTSGRGIDIDAASVSGGGDITSDNGIDILADSIELGAINITELGPVTLQSIVGDLTVGDVTSNTFGVTLTSVANLTAGNLAVVGTANASDINVSAEGNATIGDANAGNQLAIDVTGNLVAGNLTSNVVSPGTAINVGGDADIVSFDALAGTAAFTVGGALTGGTLAAESVLTINAASVDIGGAISRTQSLDVTATSGDAVIGDAQAAINIAVTANNGSPILGAFNAGSNLDLTGASVSLGAGDVVGNLTLQSLAGDITLALDGNESITVGGTTNLNSAASIIVTHANNAGGAISLDSAGNINASANGNIDAQVGSILSGFEVFLLASGAISVDDVRGVPAVQIQAGGSVTVNNATATGPQGVSNLSGITIEAGLDPFFGSAVFDNLANVLITGDVTSYASVNVSAGGSVTFAGGSNTAANDRVFVETGDDIIVASGAVVSSAISPLFAPDPSNPFNGAAAIDLQAGGITSLLSVPATPIASLVVQGTLDANGSAIIASADAIDGLGGTFRASSLAIDINDAPVDGIVPSDDNGLLSASCLEGNVCLGTIEADNIIEIGQSSNNDVIQLIVEQGSVNANEIRVSTRRDIVMGTDGIETSLNAANFFSLTSLAGDIDLRDAAISSDAIVIDAAGSLLGSGVLTSTSDISITVGADLFATSITSGGQLINIPVFDGAFSSSFSVPGTINIGVLSVGSGNIDVTAGTDVVIGSALVPGTNISITAGGLASLGASDTATDVSLTGDRIFFGTVTASGSVFGDAGSAIDFTSVTAGSDIDLFASGPINGGDLFAGGTASADGGLIAVGTVDATNISLTSASDILFDLLLSPNAIILSALNGMIGANTGNGDIESDGDVSLTAQAILVGDVTTGGSLGADASAGDASFGTVTATNNITISATGTPSVLNAVSGGSTSITGASVNFNNGTIGGDLSLTATAGNIDGNGTVTVGGAIAFDAAGSVGFGSLTAQNGDFIVSAGNDIVFTAIDSSQLVDLSAGGVIEGLRIDAVSSINLSAAGSINVDHAETPGDFTAVSGGNFTTGLNSIITGGDIIIAGDIVDLGNSTAGGLIDVTGSQIDFVNLIAGSTITLLTDPNLPTGVPGNGNLNITGTNMTAGAGASSVTALGSIDISGTSTIGGSLTMDANGDIAFGTAVVQTGDFFATAGGSINFANADVAGLVDFLAGGDINASGLMQSGNGVVLDAIAGSVSGTDILTGGLVDISAGTTVTFNDISVDFADVGIFAGGDVAINDVIGANNIDITTDGALDFNNLEAAGGVSLFSLGVMTGNNINAAGLVAFDGSSVTLNSIIADDNVFGNAESGDLVVASIDSDGDIFLIAAGLVDAGILAAVNNISVEGQNIAIDQADAGGSIDLLVTIASGGVTANSLSAATTVTVDAGTAGIDIGSLSAADADLLATGGAIGVTDAVVAGLLTAEGASVDIASSSSLTVDVTATDGDALVSTQLNLTANQASASGDLLLESTGAGLLVTDASGTNVTLSAGADIQILGSVDALQALGISAGSVLDVFDGSAIGETITISAGDVALGADSIIGDATRTQSITFNIDGEATVGGPATDAVPWLLDNDEFSRLFSDGDIIFNAAAFSTSSNPNITVEQLDVIAGDGSNATGQNIGQSGGLVFNAEGEITVLGDVTIFGATADTLLALDALASVRVNSATGGLFMLDANEGIAGTIQVTARDFYVLTDAAFAAIDGLSTAEVDALLADSGGVDRPDGVIRADTLDIDTIASDVFIQNTATGTDFDDRRGFEVNTLFISDSAGTTQPIVINGVIGGVTGIDTVPLAGITSSFDGASTINGCLIADPASCLPVVTTPPDGGGSDGGGKETPIRELIEDQIKPDSPIIADGMFDSMIFQFREDPEMQEDPLLDEPVTGAGNEDLWVGEDEEEEEDGSEDTGEELEPAE